MKVNLISLSGTKFSNEASEVRLTTLDGDITILDGHEPLLAICKPGPLIITDKDNNEELFSIYGGIVDIENGSEVNILVDDADHVDDLITDEIEEAIELANELKEKAKDRITLYQAQRSIDRNLVRLNVSKIRRRKK